MADTRGQLSARGHHQIETLASVLKRRGVAPEIVLTSRTQHAMQSATLLSDHVGRGGHPLALDVLTPGKGPGGIDELFVQAGESTAGQISRAECVLVVGHEGRLSDLLTELTGVRSRPLEHGGAACVRAADIQEMAAGRGRLHHRYPTVDHMEEVLRAKVNSKMTVATFLAGFVFTALSALLLDSTSWPWHRMVAAVTLTTSLALFVASVYIYDQLGTPSGFWTDADRPPIIWRRLYAYKEARLEATWTRLKNAALVEDEEEKARIADDDPRFFRPRQDGSVYWLMVSTSRLVFTPAVVLALTGFVALLLGTGERRIWTTGLAGLLVAGIYAAWHRPNLGAD